MSEIDDAQKVSDAHRQAVAREAQVAAFGLMSDMHHHAIASRTVGVAQDASGCDIAPIVQGMLGGIIQYMIAGGGSEATVREIFEVSMRDIIPQILMAYAAEKLGASQQGNA